MRNMPSMRHKIAMLFVAVSANVFAVEYTYDSRDRLSSAARSGEQLTFVCDEIGNLESVGSVFLSQDAVRCWFEEEAPLTAGETASLGIGFSETPSSLTISGLPSGLEQSGSRIAGLPVESGCFELVLSGTISGAAFNETLYLTVLPEIDVLAWLVEPPDMDVDEGSSFSLCGLSSGSAAAYQWFRDGVAIADETAPSLLFSGCLEESGSYVLQAAAGGTVVTSRTATVSIRSAGDSFESWVAGQGVPSSRQGIGDAPAGDGIPNLLKYACGLSAMQAYASRDLFTCSADAAAGRFVMRYCKSKYASDAELIAEWTASLAGEWSAAGVSLAKVGEEDGREVWEASVEIGESGYMRLSARATSGDAVTQSFAEWLDARAVPAEDAGVAGSPAGDGIPNLLKYAQGLDPMTACDSSDVFRVVSNRPDRIVITFRRSKTAQNVSLYPVWAESLTDPAWTAGGFELSLLSENSTQEVWEAGFPVSVGSGYIRLNAAVGE